MKKKIWYITTNNNQDSFFAASHLVLDTFSPWTIGPQEQTSPDTLGTHGQMIPIFGTNCPGTNVWGLNVFETQ